MEPKRKYEEPQAEVVIIDNAISLAMSSTPPDDPEDWD
jgi:hypothetical protein